MSGVSPQSAGSAGHRLVPHVADVMLEAWGPSRAACLEQAARGLVESFAETGATEPIERVSLSIDAAGDEDLLVSLLEEVIYVVDALGRVPADIVLTEHPDGRVDGSFATIESEHVEVIGAIPKGVSRSDLLFEQRDGEWRCHVVVDV